VEISRQEVLWVLRAQCDDREALELWLRSVQPSLRRYLRRIVGPADADDVVQEVFLIAYRKLGWLETPSLFRPWIFRIASRCGFRHWKKEKRRPAFDDEATLEQVPAPEGRPEPRLLERMLSLDTLTPATRAVLILHFQEELSLQDVAAVLEIPLGTVKSRLSYGLTILRKQLGRKE